jgi:hypothetical protein
MGSTTDGPEGLVSPAAQRDRFIEAKKAVTICLGGQVNEGDNNG